jgi:hypothetical protein
MSADRPGGKKLVVRLRRVMERVRSSAERIDDNLEEDSDMEHAHAYLKMQLELIACEARQGISLVENWAAQDPLTSG